MTGVLSRYDFFSCSQAPREKEITPCHPLFCIKAPVLICSLSSGGCHPAMKLSSRPLRRQGKGSRVIKLRSFGIKNMPQDDKKLIYATCFFIKYGVARCDFFFARSLRARKKIIPWQDPSHYYWDWGICIKIRCYWWILMGKAMASSGLLASKRYDLCVF